MNIELTMKLRLAERFLGPTQTAFLSHFGTVVKSRHVVDEEN
jgi:hypothetical protein